MKISRILITRKQKLVSSVIEVNTYMVHLSKSEPKLKTYWTHIDSVDCTINIGCAHQCCFDNSHSESKKASYLITKIKTILF